MSISWWDGLDAKIRYLSLGPPREIKRSSCLSSRSGKLSMLSQRTLRGGQSISLMRRLPAKLLWASRWRAMIRTRLFRNLLSVELGAQPLSRLWRHRPLNANSPKRLSKISSSMKSKKMNKIARETKMLRCRKLRHYFMTRSCRRWTPRSSQLEAAIWTNFLTLPTWTKRSI